MYSNVVMVLLSTRAWYEVQNGGTSRAEGMRRHYSAYAEHDGGRSEYNNVEAKEQGLAMGY